MGVGSFGNPGMGFMACGASGIMVLLSLILLIQTFIRGKGTEESVRPFAGLMLGRVIGFVIAVFIYILLLPSLGYLIATFLLMACLLVIVGRRKWWLAYPLSCSEQPCKLLCLCQAFSVPVPDGYSRFLRGEPWISFIIS